MKRLFFALLLALPVAGCIRRPLTPSPSSPAARVPALTPSPLQFRDVAAPAGLRFHHTNGGSGRFYFPETLGSGCAFFDYDQDGHPDLFLVNSTDLPGAHSSPGRPTQALYRNRADGTFQDVSRKAGLAVEMYGMGCAAADYDNDGYPDLYVSALGPDRLFHNNRNGTFTDVTRPAGINAPEWNTSVVWLDYDRDGWLDLYVCGYCQWTPALNRNWPDAQGRKHICTPEQYPGVSSRLYRNRGNGTFADVTMAAGVYEHAGKSLAALAWDESDDGWPDLLVANDLEPNLLFRNRTGYPRSGSRTFQEIGTEVGLAFSMAGKARAGMGLDTGDLAGSGREAVLVGNFSSEGLGLYRRDDQGQFTDVADQVGLVPASLPSLTFGVLFCDFDQDGRPDLLAANGHIDPNADLTGRGVTFRERPQLFRQTEDGHFQDVTAQAGPGLQRAGVYRGLAIADYDGDGRPDVLVSANGGAPLLLKNETRSGNHWLQVRLRGVKSNRDGIGARVRVTTSGPSGRVQTRRIRAGSGYCSSSDPAAFFGLGAAAEADHVEIRWPAGELQTLPHVRADQVLHVREGEPVPQR